MGEKMVRVKLGDGSTMLVPESEYKETMFFGYQAQQEYYDKYWVRNSWGFGNKMRDYLLESNARRIRMCGV